MSALGGGNLKDLAQKIRQIGGVTENRAKLIARDQTAKLNSSLTQAQHESLGVTHYRWSTSKDERVRESHAENEGQIFSWDDPPETGHPGFEVNCRCVAIPVLDTSALKERGKTEASEVVEQTQEVDNEAAQVDVVNAFLSAFRGGTIDKHADFDKAGKAFMKKHRVNLAEATATRIYTNNFYQDINYFYHHPEAQVDRRFAQARAMADLIDKTLDKLPKREGLMHRYTWFDETILAQHKVGNVVTYEAFTSTSHTKPAEQFKASSNVYLRIEGKSGREIEDLSAMNNEREVLFKRGCRFEVKKVATGEDGMIEIEIKEL